MNILTQHKAEFATTLAILLMVLNANHVLIVPGEAITLLTSVYLGGSAIVHGARAVGAGLAVKGMGNVVENRDVSVNPHAVDQVQRDQEKQALLFDALSKGKDPLKP